MRDDVIEQADGIKSTRIAQMKDMALVGIQDKYGNVRETYLEDALFIPSYPKNIISLRAAAKKNAVVCFGK